MGPGGLPADAFRDALSQWLCRQWAEIMEARRGTADAAAAVIVGIQAPQGAGKTTLVRHVEGRFAAAGLRAVGVSIDDFYLTRAEQVDLARRYPGNRYLQARGHAGTHDIGLGVRTLRRLRALPCGQVLDVPVYDKSLCQGQGDRAPRDAWRPVVGPVDIVLFEGWMLGVPAPPRRAMPHDPDFGEVLANLAGYARWSRLLDAMISFRAADPQWPTTWRCQAEASQRQLGRSAMSEAEMAAYMTLFEPAYALFPNWLKTTPPVAERHLALTLGFDRLPTLSPTA